MMTKNEKNSVRVTCIKFLHQLINQSKIDYHKKELLFFFCYDIKIELMYCMYKKYSVIFDYDTIVRIHCSENYVPQIIAHVINSIEQRENV